MTDRDIEVHGHGYTLVAEEEAPGRWQSRISGYALRVPNRWPVRPIAGTQPPSQDPGSILTSGWSAMGQSAAEAVSALAERIRRAINNAVQARPGS